MLASHSFLIIWVTSRDGFINWIWTFIFCLFLSFPSTFGSKLLHPCCFLLLLVTLDVNSVYSANVSKGDIGTPSTVGIRLPLMGVLAAWPTAQVIFFAGHRLLQNLGIRLDNSFFETEIQTVIKKNLRKIRRKVCIPWGRPVHSLVFLWFHFGISSAVYSNK